MGIKYDLSSFTLGCILIRWAVFLQCAFLWAPAIGSHYSFAQKWHISRRYFSNRTVMQDVSSFSWKVEVPIWPLWQWWKVLHCDVSPQKLKPHGKIENMVEFYIWEPLEGDECSLQFENQKKNQLVSDWSQHTWFQQHPVSFIELFIVIFRKYIVSQSNSALMDDFLVPII